MTKDEFIEKYGNVQVKFSRYYKYMFTFEGALDDGSVVEVECGGNSDDIYRFEVIPDAVETVAGLDPIVGIVYKDRQEIEGFDDY